MEHKGGDMMENFDFTTFVLMVFGVLLFAVGFFGGRQFQYHAMMRKPKESKHCCGNCTHYNGEYCTREWNNLDECYKVSWRDEHEPGDEACDDWEFDKDSDAN